MLIFHNGDKSPQEEKDPEKTESFDEESYDDKSDEDPQNRRALLVLRRSLEQVSILVQGELDSHDKLSALGKCFVFTMDFTFVQNSLKLDYHKPLVN